MPKSLDEETVLRVAKLARLDLTAEEVTSLRSELSQILAHAEKLNEVNTDDVQPLDHAADLTNRIREDEVSKSLSQSDALSNAPASDGEYFLVPEVFADSDSQNDDA